MENNKFWNLLTQAIELPFEIEDVVDIESTNTSVYIDLKDGRSFYLDINECEKEKYE